MCGRCIQADPDRPFRYAAAATGRMTTIPAWWNQFVAFMAARHHPGGAVSILRETVRLLAADPAASPQQLLTRCTQTSRGPALAGRALTAFFTSHGLALPDDTAQRRAAARRQRYLHAIPEPLQAAVVAFDRAQIEERDQNRRAGRHQLSDITLASRLRILRDLTHHLTVRRRVTGWAEVTTGDLEDFLAASPRTGLSTPTCCGGSSAGPAGTRSSSPTPPDRSASALSPDSPARSSTSPSSAHCSVAGPTTTRTRTNG